MNSHLLKRLFLILCGYFVACTFAVFIVLVVVSKSISTASLGGGNVASVAVEHFVLIAVLAAIPSFATIAIGEYRQTRSPLVYVGVGMVIGFLVAVPVLQVLIFLGAIVGMGSGWLYWLIAGRTAGLRPTTPQ